MLCLLISHIAVGWASRHRLILAYFRDLYMTRSPCRFCKSLSLHTFVDLGMSPLCESFLDADQLNQMEPFYPLHVYVCENCLLVQLQEYVHPEDIFTEYAYFSSYSDTWLRHSKDYADTVVERFNLGLHSRVVELASNDGYLLQYFVQKGIPVLGIEPAANVAEAAISKGVTTVVKFFGSKTAHEVASASGKADLIIGNNVLAQVPDLNDFVAGMQILLKPDGIITMEFPHLMNLIESNQFDTIYHEHFSYFSFAVVERVFAAHALTLFDVEKLSTHGGSLRIYARHTGDASKQVTTRVEVLRAAEEAAGVIRVDTYCSFAKKVEETKHELLEFLIKTKRQGKSIAGYGAPGKGNTLLNYCGIRMDFLDYVVDRSPHKQGKFLPGTHIPVYHPDKIKETEPDYLLILPWNLKSEVIEQNSYIKKWGGQFIVPIPGVQVYS